MADDDYEQEGAPEPQVSEKVRRWARFIELGGQKTLFHELYDYRKAPVLADLVTDAHRDLVMTLRGSGLRQERISAILGISKDRLQALFPVELESGVDIHEAAAATALLKIGMAGDQAALANYLKNHPDLKWGTKHEVTGKDGKDLIPENATQAEANQIFLAKVLAAVSTDKALFKPAKKDKLRPAKAVESDKLKPVKPGATMKKPKGD